MGDPASNHIGEIEPRAEVFVVKIWRESGQVKDAAAWRGYITHVATGRRRYITTIGELALVIVDYLAALQVQMPWYWRVWARWARERLR